MADPVLLPSGTVTFLFTDIEGSTRLWEHHPAAMREALARHHALITTEIERRGGVVVKSRGEGDSVFAVFARATDALAAACALQQALVVEPWPEAASLRVRVALHTGEADLREGDYYGPAVNRCARLRAAAHGGQVLLSLATEELVREALPEGVSLRDLGLCRLQDLAHPEHVFQLAHSDLPAAFPPLRSLDALPNNLPVQLTSFIGREEAKTVVKRLLTTTHLLTLTGSGGCGKTRLALQVAAEVLEEYPDGVWLVELAALTDPTLVPQTVASALRVREQPGRALTETLVEYLKPKALLLILDNCEHLLTACAQLADALLRACPRLRMLASSREGLGIGGEQTYRVPSLALPPSQPGLPDTRHPTPDNLLQYEAVQLFADRARLGQATFAVTQANALAVAQVCERLDGIPLAIELAAARVKALPVEQLNERLDDMFRLLTGGSRTALPRQQTLRALIDWSYELLSQPEKALLRRLSVFAGGWTLEAAEAVCGDDERPTTNDQRGTADEVPDVGRSSLVVRRDEVLDLLTSLVERSLVLYEERGGEGRYRLLETVRQYARDRLLEAGEAEGVRGRHRDWFLALVEQGLEGESERALLDRLEREHDNLRAALAWSVSVGSQQSAVGSQQSAVGSQDEPVGSPLPTADCPLPTEPEAGLRLGGALWVFWEVRGYLAEGREHLAGLLALPGAEARTAARANALIGAGRLAQWQGEYGAARALLEESLAIWHELGHKQGIIKGLEGLASVAVVQAQPERAARLFGAAEGLREAMGAPLPPADRAEHDRSVAAVRTALGEEAFTAAWAEGRVMPLDQATAYALEPDPES